jgi:hypothetical protein
MYPTYKQLLEENKSLKAAIIKLEATIIKLQERIASLEAQRNQNSRNSSQPPSKDKKANVATSDKKERSSHHEGSNRQLLPESAVTSKETRKVEICPRCKSKLVPTEEIWKWQQIELPEIKPQVHQIELVTCECPCCHLRVRPKLSEAEQMLLGPRLEGLVNLLMGQYRHSHRSVRKLIATLFPGVELSQGVISKIKERAAVAFSEPYGELLGVVVGSTDPTYVDATGWRHAKRNECAIVIRVGNAIAYALKGHQNGTTIGTLLGKQINHLVSDRGLACAQVEARIHQYCLAHLIRNVCGQAEHPAVTIKDTQQLGALHDMLQELFVDKHKAEEGKISESTWRQYGYTKWREIQDILEDLAVCGSTKKLRRFCKKVLKDIKHFFAYLRDLSYPMTNNAAEEALRNLVIARKLCFGSQSVYGKKWREELHSCIESLYRCKQPILNFFAAVIQASRANQTIPSLSALVAHRTP